MRRALSLALLAACGGATAAREPHPAPAPSAPEHITWHTLEVPLAGPVHSNKDGALSIDGSGHELGDLATRYIAALVSQGWAAEQHTPAREGEPPGVLDEIVRMLPAIEYIGVTFERAGEQIEMSVMRDDVSTEVILMYLGRS